MVRAGSSGSSPSPSCSCSVGSFPHDWFPGIAIAMDGLHNTNACFSPGRAMMPQVHPPADLSDVASLAEFVASVFLCPLVPSDWMASVLLQPLHV
ncbi:KH domain-containing protein SPIN1 [Hordeum vulgare]|nr:KH domain-containing protein SPIN1 [Hordeum vulgare]